MYLGHQHPCIGYSDEVIHMFLAKGLEERDTNFDEDEAIELIEASLDDCLQMVATQQITDGKTVLALMYVEKYLQGIWPAVSLSAQG
jgi:ADP-ribose pyrophosphatase